MDGSFVVKGNNISDPIFYIDKDAKIQSHSHTFSLKLKQLAHLT